jgi:BirA family transcriptional regulator, biotin operon repressor / biotin---[acetyl-CoA-carboxylase] ligase
VPTTLNTIQAFPWQAEALWASISPVWPDFTVEVLPELDSTNSELMRRARAGRLEPTLLVAETQTAGRGRMGRAWAAAPGASLTCSLGVALQPQDWSGLSLAVGVALAESLHGDIALKWPNDLWLRGRKLGGILVETASVADVRYAVIGMGLNIELPAAEGLSTPAAALRELLPTATPASALQAVALPLVQALRQFELQGFAPFAPRFTARDALRNRQVRLSDGREGLCQGVSVTGALQVHTAQGVQAVTSSEVSVRYA